MKRVYEKILIGILVVIMTISGIAPSVMSNSLIVKASPEITEGVSTETPTPEPTQGAEGGESDLTPTPSETPEVTPEPTPETTPEAALSATPEPLPTPATPSFGVFSVVVPSPGEEVDGIPINHIIDVSDGVDVTIPSKVNEIELSANERYLIINSTDAATTGRIIVSDGANPTLVLKGVTMQSALPPIMLNGGANATIHLAAGFENNITCNGILDSTAKEQAAIHVEPETTSKTKATLTIKGEGQLTAKGGRYSAGIGGAANRGCGDIIIESGTIKASTTTDTANGRANGAGIGGGGSNSVGITGKMGNITIQGTAKVEATSYGHGAGIGTAGTTYATEIIGNGTVTIEDNAKVIATSKGNGAGIGGGGTNNTNESHNVSQAGAGGIVIISGSVQVTATSAGNGAGIGGGGTNTFGVAGNAGTITIVDDPIVVASGGKKDIGAGATKGGISGAAGTIVIENANVYADMAKTDEVRRSWPNGDVLGRADIIDARIGKQKYDAYGSDGSYDYYATTNDEGNAYIWIPLGNQLVIHRQNDLSRPEDIRLIETINLRDRENVPTEIKDLTETKPDLLPSTEYELIGRRMEVTWNGDALPTIIYEYGIPKDVWALNADGTTFQKYTVGDKLAVDGSVVPGSLGQVAYIDGSQPKVDITVGGVYYVKTDSPVRGRIFVNTNQKVVLILDGNAWSNVLNTNEAGYVTNVSDDAPIRLKNGTDWKNGISSNNGANATLVVMDDSINSFINTSSNGASASRTAGIYVPGKQTDAGIISESAELTITGGTTEDMDVNPDPLKYKNNGKLLAQSKEYAAAIGGGCNQHAGRINIWGGDIEAAAGLSNGAGIGGGGGNIAGGGKSTGIIICGQAKVIATSEEHGAGIGGAGGGYAATAASGVSNGPSDGGNITISGNPDAVRSVDVKATSKKNGAGIGGGGLSAIVTSGTKNAAGGDGGNIIISDNVKVEATSKGNGAGIGGAGAFSCKAGNGSSASASITIKDDAVVIATSEKDGAGIGGGGVSLTNPAATNTDGLAGNSGQINIINRAHVEAKSGGHGAGIGGGGGGNGYGGDSKILTLGDDITVNASSTISGAGIGGGGGTLKSGSAEAITIHNQATIIADAGKGVTSVAGSPLGAGIGGGGSEAGEAGSCSAITIKGQCFVQATSNGDNPGGSAGAAIGGGGTMLGIPGKGGNITIENDGIADVNTGKLSGTPTVIAQGKPGGTNMDIGYGIKTGGTLEIGDEGTLIITSGNVWAVNKRTPLATNGSQHGNDVVKMRRAPHDDWPAFDPLTNTPEILLHYQAIGREHMPDTPYDYTAWTHADTGGWAYVWKPNDYIDMEINDIDSKKIYFNLNAVGDPDLPEGDPGTPGVDPGKIKRLNIGGKAIWDGSSFINVDVLEANPENEEAANFDALANAVKLEWIQVPTSDDTEYKERKNLNDIESFDGMFEYLKGQGSDNCGEWDIDNEDGTFLDGTFKNGNLWVKVTFGNVWGNVDADEYYEVGVAFYKFEVENFYTIMEIFARDTIVQMPGPTRELVNGYEKLKNNDDDPSVNPDIYGVPYELDKTDILVGGGLREPLYGYDVVKYKSFSIPAEVGHKLRTPIVFLPDPDDTIFQTLVLDQNVVNRVDVDASPPNVYSLPGGEEGGGIICEPGDSSPENVRYYRMDYLKEFVLTVKKEVAGAFADTTKLFHFTAEFEDHEGIIGWEITDGTGIVYGEFDYEDDFPNGFGFDLKHGQQIDFLSFSILEEDAEQPGQEIPPAKITVTEDDYSGQGYETSWTSTKNEFIVEENGKLEPNPLNPIEMGPEYNYEATDTMNGNLEITFTNTRADIVASAVDVKANSNFFGPLIAILEVLVLIALLMKYKRVKQQKAASRYFRGHQSK